jgi:hypothetical protein
MRAATGVITVRVMMLKVSPTVSLVLSWFLGERGSQDVSLSQNMSTRSPIKYGCTSRHTHVSVDNVRNSPYYWKVVLDTWWKRHLVALTVAFWLAAVKPFMLRTSKLLIWLFMVCGEKGINSFGLVIMELLVSKNRRAQESIHQMQDKYLAPQSSRTTYYYYYYFALALHWWHSLSLYLSVL